MQSIRTYLISAAACSLLVPFAACGGGDDGGGGGDDDVPTGMHYGYVVSKAYVPSTNTEANDWSIDIGAEKSGTPDGITDNQLGLAFATLAGQGLSVQNTITTAVDQGKILLLVDFQTADFAKTAAAGLSIKIGDPATAMPAPCSSASDTTCRHHLDGSGKFTLASGSPNATVSGPIAGGTFSGGPGDLALQVAVGSTDPIQISLHNARAKAVSASATGMSFTVGGALTVTDLNTNILPAIFNTLTGIIDHDCPRPRPLDPTLKCGCAGSTGTIIGLFDVAPTRDCELTLAEVLNSNFIKAVLAPDVCSTAKCDKADALSIGLKFDAVKATF